ncbi:MAG: hypothetical protein ACREAD_01780 [Nitrosopumilaceae archaeon]
MIPIKLIFVTLALSLIVTPGILFVYAPTLNENSSSTDSLNNSNQTLDFSSFSSSTSIQPDSTNCVSQVEQKADTINRSLDTSKAISLASNAGDLKTRIQGYNSTFNSIFDTWSYDKNCNLTMKTINVVYSLYNATGFVKNVVITEDPNSSQINNITEQKPPKFSGFVNWSGYEMYGSNTPQNDLTYKTQAIWNVPSVYEPYIGACFFQPCDLGIWTGLSPSSGGLALNGSAALVQTGTDSCVGDFPNQCTSGSFYAWYEFLDTNHAPPVVCNLLNVNDQVSVDVINEQSGGNPTNKYDIHNVDTTASTMCTPIIGHIFNTDTPHYAQYINERIGTTQQNAEAVPKFGSDTMIGYMTDHDTGFQSISVPYGKGFYNISTMNDQSGQNINFGGASSGSFIQFWSQNCSPPGTGTSWTIQQSCTLVSDYVAGANIEIWPSSILTIASGKMLNIDLTQNHIEIDNNGGLLIEGGGKISKN